MKNLIRKIWDFVTVNKYYRMEDAKLQEEASKWKIRSYGNASGSIERQIIIDGLLKKDNANNSRYAIFVAVIAVIISASTLGWSFINDRAINHLNTDPVVEFYIRPKDPFTQDPPQDFIIAAKNTGTIEIKNLTIAYRNFIYETDTGPSGIVSGGSAASSSIDKFGENFIIEPLLEPNQTTERETGFGVGPGFFNVVVIDAAYLRPSDLKRYDYRGFAIVHKGEVYSESEARQNPVFRGIIDDISRRARQEMRTWLFVKSFSELK